MSTDLSLDVRPIVPRERHATVFKMFDGLVSGAHMVLISDHDPLPLRRQFETKRGQDFSWVYLESGPLVWRVRIGRDDNQLIDVHPPVIRALAVFQLEDEADKLVQAMASNTQNRHAMSLVKEGPLNVLLMKLKKGAELASHSTRGPIIVQVVAGAIRFRAGDDQMELREGNLVSLKREIVHSVIALTDTTLLLTTVVD